MKSIGQIALVAALVFASGQAIAAETIIGEAEDFRIGKGDWKRQKYGENYYVGDLGRYVPEPESVSGRAGAV